MGYAVFVAASMDVSKSVRAEHKHSVCKLSAHEHTVHAHLGDRKIGSRFWRNLALSRLLSCVGILFFSTMARGTGRGRGAKGSASSGSGGRGGGRGRAAGVPTPTSAGTTSTEVKVPQEVKSKAQQKIRENFRLLSNAEVDLVIDRATSWSLRQRLEHDIMARNAGQQKWQKYKTQNTQKHVCIFVCILFTWFEGDKSVVWGKNYYREMTELYVTAESLFDKLSAKEGDDSVVDEKLMEATLLGGKLFSVFLVFCCCCWCWWWWWVVAVLLPLAGILSVAFERRQRPTVDHVLDLV